MIALVLLGQLLFPGSVSGQPAINPVPLQVYAQSVGARIDDTPNTVMHVTWNGTGLVDSYANSWTQNGTVPQVTTSPLYPAGFTGAQKPGAGPFSSANYYSMGAPQPLNFTGDFTVCAVWSGPGDSTNNQSLAGAGSYLNDGWYLFVAPLNNGVLLNTSAAGSEDALHVTGTLAATGVHVACGGRAATTGMLKVDGGSIATSPFFNVVNPGRAAYVGYVAPAVSPASHLTIYEVWASTDTPSDALFTRIENRFFGMAGANNEPITITRNTPSTYVPVAATGTVYAAPPNTTRVTENGILIEPLSTNLLLYSQDLTQTAWTKGTANTASPSAAAAPDGTVTGTQLVTAATGTNTISQAITSSATVGSYTFSVWLKSVSGALTGHGVEIYDSTAAAALCSTSASLTTSWARYSCTGTATTGHALAAWITPSMSTTVLVWGAQAETRPLPTSYIATTTATVTRNADVVDLPANLNPNEGCLLVTVTPSWTGAPPGYGGGFISTTANSILYANSGDANVDSYQGSAPAAAVTHGFTANVPKAYRVKWSKAANFYEVDNITDGILGAAEAPFTGYSGGVSQLFSASGDPTASPYWISNITVGLNYTACR